MDWDLGSLLILAGTVAGTILLVLFGTGHIL